MAQQRLASPNMNILGPTVIVAALALCGRIAWLGFCFCIAHWHTKEAAKIIEATGRWFPIRTWLSLRGPHER